MVSFTLQIDFHASVAVNPVVTVIDIFYLDLALAFCFSGIIARFSVFAVVIVGIRMDFHPSQKPAYPEFLLVFLNEPVSL